MAVAARREEMTRAEGITAKAVRTNANARMRTCVLEAMRSDKGPGRELHRDRGAVSVLMGMGDGATVLARTG